MSLDREVAMGDSTLRLLLRLETRRLADPFRHPRAGGWAAVALPAALGIAALWLGGERIRPDPSEDGAVALGVLVAAPVAFWSYPVLFRPGDDGFLRRLGIAAGALYALRALRLGALALLVILLAMVPYAATGSLGTRPLAAALAAAAVAWGGSLFAQSGAAHRVATPGARSWGRVLPLAPGLRDSAPLVFAPLGPFVLGALAARLTLSPPLPPWGWVAALAALSLLAARAGAGRFARALPRFAPRAGELAYAPPPEAGEGELIVGRGLAGLLPPRAGAVRARDALVASRRFRWAGRLAWSVAIVCTLAILRAGGSEEVRGWVAAAGGLVLAAQGAAVIGVGRLERGGPRWVDRGVGATVGARLLGRWAAGFGMTLPFVVPVGIAWALMAPGGGGSLWIVAGGATALVASVASLAAAGS